MIWSDGAKKANVLKHHWIHVMSGHWILTCPDFRLSSVAAFSSLTAQLNGIWGKEFLWAFKSQTQQPGTTQP